MKKGGLIFLLGLLLATAGFTGFYYIGTASSRHLMRHPQPELAWLKKEFALNDAELQRISNLHQAYLPKCAERCRLIQEKSAELQRLLASASSVTPEISRAISDRAAMRADCETEMLKHFLEVSRTMPPQQGRRYLLWVQQQAFSQGEGMERQHHLQQGHDPAHAAHGH